METIIERNGRGGLSWHWRLERNGRVIAGGYENTKRDAQDAAKRAIRSRQPTDAQIDRAQNRMEQLFGKDWLEGKEACWNRNRPENDL